MPRIFQIIKKVTQVVEGGSGGGEVTNERLIYELPEIVPAITDSVNATAQVRASEIHADPQELAIALAAVTGVESIDSPDEDVLITGTVEPEETHPVGEDDVTLVGTAAEEVQTPGEDATVLAAVLTESAPTPEESNLLTVTVTKDEPFGPIGDAALIVLGSSEAASVASDEGYVNIFSDRAGDAVVTNSNFGTATNTLDRDFDAAVCQLQTTNTTQQNLSGTVEVSFADFAITDLTDITEVKVGCWWHAQSTGTNALTSYQRVNMSFQWWDGSAWVTVMNRFSGANNNAVWWDADDLIDITASIGDDWAKLDSLKLRVTGIVRANAIAFGTGTTNCSVRSLYAQVRAQRTYT